MVRRRAHTDNVDEGDLVLLNGCYCMNTQIECSKYCGCSGEFEVACIQSQCCLNFEADSFKTVVPSCCRDIGECIGCGCGLLCYDAEKSARLSNDQHTLCQLGLFCCALGIKSSEIGCCKSQAQLCCLVQSGALPPDKEVPPTGALLGIQCYPKCGCCQKLHDLTAGAPPTLEMQR